MAETNWHQLSAEDTFRRFETDPAKGLGEKEAAERLAAYGPNELRAEKKRSAFGLFLRQFTDTLIIILLFATALSAAVGEVFDAGLILLIVIFSAGLGFIQEHKAERAIEALKKMLAPTVSVIRDGRLREIPVRELVPGDVLGVEAGNKLPADLRIFESFALKADEAPLTGESVPVEKTLEPLPAETLVADRTNMLFAGTTITYGRGLAVVVATGMQSELGKIALQVTAIKAEKTPLEKRTAEIGKWLGIIALVVCVSVGGLGMIRKAATADITLDFTIEIIMFAVALAVAAVPEALAAIVTGTLAIGMHEMAKRNALIRRMPAVETLGSVTVICSDKTGTITKGEMTVRKFYASGTSTSVSGVGYAPEGEFGDPGFRAGKHDLFFKAGVLCNDSELFQEESRWVIKGDPTEGALLTFAAKAGIDFRKMRTNSPRTGEVPFSSERKLMTTINETGGAGMKTAFTKGAPEVVLDKCASEEINGTSMPLSESRRAEVLKLASGMAAEGLRVLAFSTKKLDARSHENPETDMLFLGLTGMMDPPREEAVRAVEACKKIGIKPVMITGDHKLTATAVAMETGIYSEGDIALTGEELERLSDEEFEKQVKHIAVYARVSPMDKLKIVKAWKKHGEIVAMTGDGVNDAPALKHADIGIAMGITGTDVTKEAADMILSDDNFATILKAIERGRWIFDNIKKYLTYLLRANIVEVLVLGGVVIWKGPEYLPLLPAAILFINLITDGLPALALGISPPEPDIMTRPPRDPKEGVFSFDVVSFIVLALLIEAPFFYWIFLSTPDLLDARTELFFLFILVELIIALNFRSLRYSMFKVLPHKWLMLSVIGSAILTFGATFVPQVRESFGITTPTIEGLEYVLIIAVAVTASIELMKLWLRKKAKAQALQKA